MNLEGKKYGPSNSQITFTVQGITNGAVWVTALVDNQQVLAPTEVVIGSGIPTSVPATTAVPVVTTTVPATKKVTDTETETETTTTPVETGATVPATTEMTTVTTIPATRATTAAPATFNSADQQVSLTAQGVDYAALMRVSESNVPDTWLSVGSAYTIAPDSLTFDPPATLSFAVPAGNDYAYFIGQYTGNAWTAVPSTAGAGSIDTDIDRAGTYALMAFKPESTIQPAATGTATGGDPDTARAGDQHTEDCVDRAGRFPVRCPDKGPSRQHGRDRGACDRPRALRADAAVIARWGKPHPCGSGTSYIFVYFFPTPGHTFSSLNP